MLNTSDSQSNKPTDEQLETKAYNLPAEVIMTSRPNQHNETIPSHVGTGSPCPGLAIPRVRYSQGRQLSRLYM